MSVRTVDVTGFKIGFLAALLICSLHPAFGQAFVAECKLPFQSIAQNHPIDNTCGKEGAGTGALATQNTVKNNFCALAPAASLKFSDFDSLQRGSEEKGISTGRGRIPTDRAPLRNMVNIASREVGEGSLVSLAAFIDSVRNTASESVNCKQSGVENNDIHVNLVENPGADLCASVTAEISPHFRPVAWAHLGQMAITRPVRITGQLFFDADHLPCQDGQRSGPHPKRRSTWEIHPVYGIGICNYDNLTRCVADDESAWVPLDQWKNEDSSPAKLGITITPSIVHPSSNIKVQVSLLNSANEPASLKQEISITLTIESVNGGYRDQRSLTVPAGQAWSTVIVQLPSGGIYSLTATTPQLRPSSTFLSVVADNGVSSRWGKATLHDVSFRLPAILFAVPPPQLALRQQVMVLISPSRELMADGLDAAQVTALTSGDVAHQDISINLHSSLGFFDCPSLDKPKPCADYQLILPKGSTHAEARLTSTQAGTSSIVAVSSTPNMELVMPSAVIVFGPPITKIAAEASPPNITLLGRSQLIVRLTDDQGKIYVPSHPRKISVSIKKGEGHFDPEDSTITLFPPNNSAELAFLPGFGTGDTELTASTDQLPSADLHVRTSLPVALILIAALGGLVGGAIFISVHRKASRTRIAVGAVTGFILYWAVVFGVITTKSSLMVVSPLSDFAISVIGGWLGTEVFSVILKRFGVEASR